jgi:cytochrome c
MKRVVHMMVLVILSIVGVAPWLAFAQGHDEGKQAFAQCSACHSIDGSNGVGPPLSGVVGRKAGSVAGFRYSRAMKGSNIVWDEKSLDAFVSDPQKVVPGNVMPFAGVADAKQRADLIAYLQKLN